MITLTKCTILVDEDSQTYKYYLMKILLDEKTHNIQILLNESTHRYTNITWWKDRLTNIQLLDI